MPKTEVNWGVLNVDLAGFPPEVAYEDAIEAETRRMMREIAATASPTTSIGKKIVGFAYNNPEEDLYVKQSAMHKLLDEQGVLDTYFNYYDDKRAHHVPTLNGWELWLAPNFLPGALKVYYDDKTGDGFIGRYVLRYVTPRPSELEQ